MRQRIYKGVCWGFYKGCYKSCKKGYSDTIRSFARGLFVKTTGEGLGFAGLGFRGVGLRLRAFGVYQGFLGFKGSRVLGLGFGEGCSGV